MLKLCGAALFQFDLIRIVHTQTDLIKWKLIVTNSSFFLLVFFSVCTYNVFTQCNLKWGEDIRITQFSPFRTIYDELTVNDLDPEIFKNIYQGKYFI